MGFVVPTVIAGFADCLRLWHILVQQTEVRAPRRPVVAARLLDAVSSWQTCKWWLTIGAGYKEMSTRISQSGRRLPLWPCLLIFYCA